jgi:hypothetical protein
VTVSGDTGSGLTYSVAFDPLANPGNQPLLRVSSTANLSGSSAAVAVRVLNNGSLDQWYTPIPADMLQLPVEVPDTLQVGPGALRRMACLQRADQCVTLAQIELHPLTAQACPLAPPPQVEVNGVPSACSAASPAACTFSYSADATPSVTSASPGSVNLKDQAVSITISGTGLAASPVSNTVTIGSWPCANVTVTAIDASNSSLATELQCELSQHTPSGTWPVVVQVAGRGAASSSAQLTVSSLWLSGVSPTALPANATVLLNITGWGFDLANCSRHRVAVAGQPAGVVSCGPGYLSVLAATPSAAADAVPVTVSLHDAPSSTTHSASLANSTLSVSATLPTIAAITSPSAASLVGSSLVIQLTGAAAASSVASLQLLSAFAPLSGVDLGTADMAGAAAALAAPLPCLNIRAEGSAGAFSCSLGFVPRGSYYLLMSTYTDDASSSTTAASLFTQQTLTSDLSISSVHPALGSIGGGTLLTISGSGFSSPSDANVVLLHVPVSSTFPNGVVLCDVQGGDASQLTCRTRAHLATDASAEDPDARAVEPLATRPGCAAGWCRLHCAILSGPSESTRCLRLTCSRAHALQGRGGGALRGGPGGHRQALLLGRRLQGAQPLCSRRPRRLQFRVRLARHASPGLCLAAAGRLRHQPHHRRQRPGRRAACGDGGCCRVRRRRQLQHFAAGRRPHPLHGGLPAGWLHLLAGSAGAPPWILQLPRTRARLQVPALPAGAYTIALYTAGGEASVDAQRAGRFLLLPTLTSATTTAANGTALPLAAGSLAGGSLLTLTSSAGDWGAGFNDTDPESNVVTVAGQACPVVSVSSAQLTCRVPRASGVVLVEYWALPWGTAALPDLGSYANPGEGECCLLPRRVRRPDRIARDEAPTAAARCCHAAASRRPAAAAQHQPQLGQRRAGGPAPARLLGSALHELPAR